MGQCIGKGVVVMTEKTGKKNRRRPSLDTKSLDVLLGFHTRLAMMEIRRSYLRHVGHGEVRPGLASLLQLVAANPGASQIEISRAMHIDKASLVSLLDKAESAGWLNRERSEEDRRRHELVLSPTGEKMAAKLRRQTLRHEEKFLKRFSASELKQLVAYLRRIYE
jgi:DNA-binding MarR family transcriptional regulator